MPLPAAVFACCRFAFLPEVLIYFQRGEREREREKERERGGERERERERDRVYSNI